MPAQSKNSTSYLTRLVHITDETARLLHFHALHRAQSMASYNFTEANLQKTFTFMNKNVFFNTAVRFKQ